MERYEILNALLKPADLLVGAQLSLLRRAGVYEQLQDGAYRTMARVLRASFEKMNHLEVEGLERVPAGSTILASNHQSWYDVQVLAASFPRRVHFMAKAEFRQWPLMRHMVDFNRSFYIDRTGGDRSGMREAEAWLAAGEAVAMYPEATIPGEEELARSKVEPATALLRGRTGMIRLAIASGAPIVPVGVSGSSAAFPPEMFPLLEVPPIPRPERITLRFGEPIRFGQLNGQEIDGEELRRLTDEVMARISDLVDHHRQWVPMARISPDLLEVAERDERRVGVLILHGFTSSLKCVDGLLPYMERHGFPWRMPVLRGHGTVYTDLSGVGWEDWVKDAEKSLDDLLAQCDRAVVVGLSMGGLVALELALRHPEKLAGVVALAPALRFLNPLASFSGVLAKVVRYWPSPYAFRDSTCAEKNENYPRFATDAFASLYRFGSELEQRLHLVSAPALIIQSRKDQVVDPKGAGIILERIGAAEKELVWFNRSGHELLLDMEADAVLPIVEEFLLERRKSVHDGPAQEQGVRA